MGGRKHQKLSTLKVTVAGVQTLQPATLRQNDNITSA